MRNKPSVKRHEIQPESPGQDGRSLDILQVWLPGRVRGNPSGDSNRVQRGIILSNAAEHTRDDRNTLTAQQLACFAPDGRGFTRWVQRELDPADACCLQFRNEV